MRRELSERRIAVTGASRGIGKLVALKLAEQSAKLMLIARSAEALNETAKLVQGKGGDATVCVADLTTDPGRQSVYDAIQNKWNGLDALINNAGVASWGHFSTSTPEILRKVMETNFFAPTELIRICQPLLMRGNEPAIVNVASLCGRRGMPAWPEHSASKSALVGLTEGLRAEFQRYDIDVLLVIPGLTRSDDLSKHLLRKEGKAKLDFANATPPEDVADAIVEALQANRNETWVGTDTKRLLRFSRWFPNLTRRLIARKVRKLYKTEAEA